MSLRLLSLLLLFFLSACGGGGGGGGSGDTSRQWLVLVYMAADNNLSSFATLDLNEMAAVKYTPQVKLVALTDFSNGADLISESDDTTGELTSKQLNYEVDSGNYETLEDFIRTYYSRYPAKHVALILWDHGDGWRSTRIAGIDESSSDYLFMFQLRKALSNLKNDGITFDIIGFDECFMGMEEVLYDIKDFASYFVASENTEPGDGWNYKAVLSYLVSNPYADPESFGRAIVDAYRGTYSSYVSTDTLTLTLFSRNDVEEIAGYLNDLYYYLDNSTFSDFKLARDSAQQVVGSASNSGDLSYYYVDLYTFASNLPDNYTAAVRITEIIDSLYRAVIPGGDGKDLHGLSIYFPANQTEADSSGFSCYILDSPGSCYINGQQVEGYYNPFAETEWDDFLEKYLSLESSYD